MLERGGALVSEYLPGEEPLKWRFPQRNRLISGFSRGIVVVEAPEKSGALITADYALEQGRDLFVHTVSSDSVAGSGARKYAHDGAPVIRSAEDILRIWDSDMMPVYTSVRDAKQCSAGQPAQQYDIAAQLAFEFEKELFSAIKG
jgi:predicted Rossmann fold nucleotide-binding protein DprA/Smf involved in DNA uptake